MRRSGRELGGGRLVGGGERTWSEGGHLGSCGRSLEVGGRREEGDCGEGLDRGTTCAWRAEAVLPPCLTTAMTECSATLVRALFLRRGEVKRKMGMGGFEL